MRVTALVEGSAGRPTRKKRERMPEELLGERVEIKDLDAEEVQSAHAFLRELLVLMDIQADVDVREPETAADGLGRATAVLDVEGEDLGLLIGRRGSTLAALQYFVNVLVTRKLDSRVLVTVDVEHYHRRREETLHEPRAADGGPRAAVSPADHAGADARRRAPHHPHRAGR